MSWSKKTIIDALNTMMPPSRAVPASERFANTSMDLYSKALNIPSSAIRGVLDRNNYSTNTNTVLDPAIASLRGIRSGLSNSNYSTGASIEEALKGYNVNPMVAGAVGLGAEVAIPGIGPGEKKAVQKLTSEEILNSLKGRTMAEKYKQLIKMAQDMSQPVETSRIKMTDEFNSAIEDITSGEARSMSKLPPNFKKMVDDLYDIVDGKHRTADEMITGKKSVINAIVNEDVYRAFSDAETTLLESKPTFTKAPNGRFTGSSRKDSINTAINSITDDTLVNEARKYKSADEFVKSRVTGGNNSYYHGTTKAGADNIDKVGFIKTKGGFNKGRGISVSKEYDISNEFASGGVFGKSQANDGDVFKIEVNPKAKVVDVQDFLDLRNELKESMVLTASDIKAERARLGVSELSMADETRLKFRMANDLAYKEFESRGVDIIDASKRAFTVGQEQAESIILNPDVIKSKTRVGNKSQLTDIWNKANGTKKRPDVASKDYDSYLNDLANRVARMPK